MFVSKTKKLARAVHLRSEIFARDIGILKGQKNYQKFVILGLGRSGSNLIKHSLDSHSKVLVFGELFRHPDRIGWDRYPYNECLQSQHLVAMMHAATDKFLEKEVFRNFSPNISAVGFKIFYHHAQKDSRKKVWSYLRENKEIKIIHLKRRNMLERYLSLKIAQNTNQWRLGKEDKVEQKAITLTIPFEELAQNFEETKSDQINFDKLFLGNKIIDIFYENLSNSFDAEINRIQNFLDIECESLIPMTKRQRSKSLSETILNYQELKERFRYTPWEKFFYE
jgi:LPS sulfotransferase NodH